MANLTPDQTLALTYVPVAKREAVRALWQLDAVLGAAAFTSREVMIRRIKLAWWREALERLDSAPPPAEPTLEALARHVLPLGITGAELSELEDGWAQLTDEDSSTYLHDYASGRGGRLFALTARLLGQDWAPVRTAGEGWALADLAHRGEGTDVGRAAALIPAERWPSALRPLGMLAKLAADDAARGVQPQGSPGRMLRMLRHRLTGR